MVSPSEQVLMEKGHKCKTKLVMNETPVQSTMSILFFFLKQALLHEHPRDPSQDPSRGQVELQR